MKNQSAREQHKIYKRNIKSKMIKNNLQKGKLKKLKNSNENQMSNFNLSKNFNWNLIKLIHKIKILKPKFKRLLFKRKKRGL